jgi:hypothetical protein
MVDVQDLEQPGVLAAVASARSYQVNTPCCPLSEATRPSTTQATAADILKRPSDGEHTVASRGLPRQSAGVVK